MLESRQLLSAITLAGSVYQDLNNNGNLEAGEAGIAGVKITLTGKTAAGASVTMTTTTNTQGRYSFSVAAGTYSVAETQAAGYLNGKTSTGFVGGAKAGTDIVTGVNVTGLVSCAAADFGEIKPGGISGTVYVDANNNGVIDVNEKRISNVLITLTGANDQGAVTLTAHTDANGNYSFGNLRPGTYVITETQLAGYLLGKLTLGSAGGTIGAGVFSSVKIGQGVIGANYNFGEQLPPPPPPPPSGGGTGGGTGGSCHKAHSDGNSDGSKDCKNKGHSAGGSDGNSDGHSDGSKDCKNKAHSAGGSDGHSDGSKDCKNKGGSDGHSDGGKDCNKSGGGNSGGGKDCHCDGHPDNGNNKNNGCGNAYGVPNRDAKSHGKGH